MLPSSAAGGKPIFVMHSALNASSYISPFLIKSNFRPDSFLYTFSHTKAAGVPNRHPAAAIF